MRLASLFGNTTQRPSQCQRNFIVIATTDATYDHLTPGPLDFDKFMLDSRCMVIFIPVSRDINSTSSIIGMELISCWPPDEDNSESEQGPNSLQHDVDGEYIPLPRGEKSEQKRADDDSTFTANKRPKHSHHEEEAFANIALARWWRSEGRHSVKSPPSSSGNPNTFLHQLSCLPEAKSYISQKIKQLEYSIKNGDGSPRMHAALATFLEKVGDFKAARHHIDVALHLDPTDKELQWLQHRIKTELRVQAEQQKRSRELGPCGEMASRLPQSTPVERREASGLSFQEFFFQYAMTGTPVIITGAVDKMTSVSWTLEHILEIAGSCPVTLRKLVSGSVNWAQLEPAELTTVKQFISNLSEQDSLQPDEQRYLFDWSLPLNCPELCEEITIPKYFAGDFLQRSSPGSLYRDSWPSLFIAPRGLCSELHVDAFGSNFWMALFQGRKRWMFFSKEDLPSLYPCYPSDQSTDPVFSINLRAPDIRKYPLLSLVKPRECTLQPGELLFVPAGCPHYVENLEQSLAISSNFVDLSNLSAVRGELVVNGLIDDRAKDLLEQMDSSDFCTKMNSRIEDTSWKDFKTWPKNYSDYDY